MSALGAGSAALRGMSWAVLSRCHGHGIAKRGVECYAMMGLSLYLASQRRTEESLWRASRVLFGIQLALNGLWSYVFFGRRAPGWALVEILFLWVTIAATTRAFLKISKTAGLLLLPYLLWTSFAAVLNRSIWRLNR